MKTPKIKSRRINLSLKDTVALMKEYRDLKLGIRVNPLDIEDCMDAIVCSVFYLNEYLKKEENNIN